MGYFCRFLYNFCFTAHNLCKITINNSLYSKSITKRIRNLLLFLYKSYKINNISIIKADCPSKTSYGGIYGK